MAVAGIYSKTNEDGVAGTILIQIHIALEPTEHNGLSELWYAKCEQIMIISKDRLMGRYL